MTKATPVTRLSKAERAAVEFLDDNLFGLRRNSKEYLSIAQGGHPADPANFQVLSAADHKAKSKLELAGLRGYTAERVETLYS